MLAKQKICVSAIIPCFERPNELKRLLNSFLNLRFSKFCEIIVIDDGSQNHQAIEKAIAGFSAKTSTIPCRLIRFEHNQGPAEARNIGVKKSRGEFIWFLDSDTTIDNPLLIENMVHALEKNQSLAGVGGEAVKIDNQLYSSVAHHFPNWFFSIKFIPAQTYMQDHPKCIATNNLMIRKKDFLKTSGFLPFFDTYEDNDFCLQLIRSGKSLLMRNDTCLTHHHASSGRQGGNFSFFNKMWSYVWIIHLNRAKILLLHFPYRLPFLPLLDIIFAPVVLFSQIFLQKKRSSDLFQEKSKGAGQGFVVFVLFNCLAMILTWLAADFFMIKYLLLGKERFVNKIRIFEKVDKKTKIL